MSWVNSKPLNAYSHPNPSYYAISADVACQGDYAKGTLMVIRAIDDYRPHILHSCTSRRTSDNPLPDGTNCNYSVAHLSSKPSGPSQLAICTIIRQKLQ